ASSPERRSSSGTSRAASEAAITRPSAPTSPSSPSTRPTAPTRSGPPMRIHHLALRTSDLASLERFYGEVLGLPITRRQGERSTWLDASGTIVMLERRDAGEPPIPPGSQELVAFELDSISQRDLADRLAAAHVPIEARTASTLYVRDPDGRRVGL